VTAVGPLAAPLAADHWLGAFLAGGIGARSPIPPALCPLEREGLVLVAGGAV
jgi:hypothetical protein